MKKIDNNKKCRYSAFTLAETLITIAILGLIAAVAVPSLVRNLKQRMYISTWKKAYSEISQVMDLLVIQYPNAKSFKDVVNEISSQTGLPRNAAVLELLKPYFKVEKYGCDGGGCAQYSSNNYDWGCFGITGSYIFGTHLYYLNSSTAIGYDNGAKLIYYNNACIKTKNYSIAISQGGSSNASVIYATKKVKDNTKHVVGKDVFIIDVSDLRKIKPYGSTGLYDGAQYACDSNGNGYACSAKYLYGK